MSYYSDSDYKINYSYELEPSYGSEVLEFEEKNEVEYQSKNKSDDEETGIECHQKAKMILKI